VSGRPRAELLVEDAAELMTCAPESPDLVGRVPGGHVAIGDGRILAAGPARDVESLIDRDNAQVIDATGKVVMPGFVDCHTHVVFAGSRVDEYVTKVSGGDLNGLGTDVPVGILGTVRLTRRASVEELAEAALSRLEEMLAAGTTTLESKSGYGLTLENELAILEVNRRLGEAQPIDIVSTFLGAHAIPPETNRADYVRSIVEEMVPRVAEEGLAQFCDVYCDDGYFTPGETATILEAGLEWGLRPKLHLDAYSHTGAASLATDLPCVSVDHLNFTTESELEALAEADVVGVVMPALDFAVEHPHPSDPHRIIGAGMPLALATDMCPSCWLASMQFVVNLACRHRLTVAQAIRASTLNAAQALGLEREVGSLEPGKLADVIILDVERHEELGYQLGRNAVETVIKRGRIVVER
jgi:imidazolonepropionase